MAAFPNGDGRVAGAGPGLWRAEGPLVVLQVLKGRAEAWGTTHPSQKDWCVLAALLPHFSAGEEGFEPIWESKGVGNGAIPCRASLSSQRNACYHLGMLRALKETRSRGP